MHRSSTFKTISECSSANWNKTDWSQFENTTFVSLNQASRISNLVVTSEKFCIISCHKDTLCFAIHVDITSYGSVQCQLLSHSPYIGKVKNQTGSRLLLKGRQNVYNIDTDGNTQCDGIPGCYSLVFDGNVYVIMTGRYFADKTDARNACLSMPTSTGEFDLAILDTMEKISAVKVFMSTVPHPGDLWLYIGAEAGVGVDDPANKWIRSGSAIANDLWAATEPNLPDEQCVMVAEIYNGLMDVPCTYFGKDINTLCQYFCDEFIF